MKKKSILCLMLILTVLISLAVQVGASEFKQGIEGNWLGKLQVSGMELRLVFKFAKNVDGSFTAIMDSPDQGVKDIPIDQVVFEDGTVRLEAKAMGMVYEGELSEDGMEIIGTFTQNSFSLPLNFERSLDEIANTRPQEPKKPYPYFEEEVVYINDIDGVKLAGTLTLPRAEGSFSAVILISGSGAQDRDEAILGHKPFLVLADYLTRQGIAVLRVDDRGVGGSTGDISSSTSENFAKDVLAGVEYLKSCSEINHKQIGLIGHSEGGLIAPMVAANSEDIAFIVMMAGPGILCDELIYLQTELINRASGLNEEEIKAARKEQEQIFTIVMEEEDSLIREKKVRELITKSLQELSEEEKKSLGDIEQYIEGQVRAATSNWFRYFITYDPVPVLKKVKCSVLAINGSKDLQVPPKENLMGIETVLNEGQNKDFKVIEIPELNHLFQTCETGSLSEYAIIQETISPAVLKIIGDWILEHTNIR